ncbi:MAG: hypothetical protein ACI837_002689 [Crocinitomicaceae bacterium]|jgi:hypothetical protein
MGNLSSERLFYAGKVQRKHLIKNTYIDTTLVKKEIADHDSRKIVQHQIETYENGLLIKKEDLLRKSMRTYTYFDDKTIKTETSISGNGEKVYYKYYLYDEHENTIVSQTAMKMVTDRLKLLRTSIIDNN